MSENISTDAPKPCHICNSTGKHEEWCSVPDAPKPSEMADRLWEIFRLGQKAGVHYRIRHTVDKAEGAAAKLISELSAMRSPEEVRAEREWAVSCLVDQTGWTKGYCDALKWVLREEG